MRNENRSAHRQTGFVQASQERILLFRDNLTDAAASGLAWLFPELQRAVKPDPQPVVIRREEKHVWIDF